MSSARVCPTCKRPIYDEPIEERIARYESDLARKGASPERIARGVARLRGQPVETLPCEPSTPAKEPMQSVTAIVNEPTRRLLEQAINTHGPAPLCELLSVTPRTLQRAVNALPLPTSFAEIIERGVARLFIGEPIESGE